jgi:RNA polymerase sigma-70 factor (ECF subfamily)
LSIGKSKENAMDITQNVFVKTYQKLESYRKIGSFSSWIARIAYHESINWYKKNRKYLNNIELDEVFQVRDPEISQEDEILAKENRAQLLKSLLTLNTRHRVVVVLRYFETMSISEISDVLRCSEGMVKNILYRSLQNLKNHLHDVRKEEYHDKM